MKMNRWISLLWLVMCCTPSLARPMASGDVKAFCIDFNWGDGGPNGFARPGLWADADPAHHVAWYKALGVNVIQTFCVSCNGYAWYRGGVVPAQPGLEHDFLTDVVRLGHKEGMSVMGYFCIGANTRWGSEHPDQSYGSPAHTHIPFTTDYNDLPLEAVSRSTLPVPSQGQITWHEQERLMFVCLDPATWQGREYDNHTTKLTDMTLPMLDTDQWCEAASAWGANMILFVAKHTGGFCWWQTDTSDYSVKNIAWKDGKGCLLTELAQSCGRYGINLGIYIYPGDDTWGAGIGSGGKTRDPQKQEAYNRVFRQQLREATRIAKQHTKVVEFWFDGSCIIEVGDIMKAEAPDAVVFQGPHANLRWVGTERGTIDYNQSWCTVNKADLETGVSTSFHSTPDGDAWAPCEVNTTLYDHQWFWSKSNESKRKGLDELMRVYYESVGQGAVMLLNSTPDTRGLIPDDDMTLYRALGAEIKRRFNTPIAQTQGRGTRHVLNFEKPTPINHVIVMEDYTQGERIRQYVVDAWDGTTWKEITGGTHVGRKHINFFDDTVAHKLRLTITECAAAPLIKRFAAYHVLNFDKPAIVHHTPWHATADKIAQIKQAMQSNWTLCTTWSQTDFNNGSARLGINLTGKIIEAGQWQVKFTRANPMAELVFSHAVLLQQGQASVPGVLTQSTEDPMIWNINRTAVVTQGTDDMHLTLTLSGKPCAGDVTVRRR